MYCNNCGKDIDNDAVFCTYCGTSLTQDEACESVNLEDADTCSCGYQDECSNVGGVKKDFTLALIMFFVSLGCLLLTTLFASIDIVGVFDEQDTSVILTFIFSLFACGAGIVSLIFGLKESRGYKILYIANLMYNAVNFIASLIILIHYFSN